MSSIRADIAIVGGGAAGVAAAIAAARKGASVVLIDRIKNIGGLASNAEVGTICGLYRFEKSSRFHFNVGMFAKEFAMELQVRSNSAPQLDQTGLSYLPYSAQHFSQLCLDLLQEEGVECQVAEVVGVEAENGKITGLILVRDEGKLQLDVQAVVDASGVSRISKILHLPLIETQFLQSASQVFTLANVPFENERNLSLVVLKALRKGVLSGELEETEDRLYLVPGSLDAGRVALKVTVPATMEEDVSKLDLKNRAVKVIHHLMEFLKSHESAFAEIELESVAPVVGVRVGDRPVGKHVLSDLDVLECRKHTSSIARGNWPMEIWSQAKRVEIRHLIEGDYYDIPAECLVTNLAENLYFAGRCISSSDNAIASARVIATCLQTGYAAGILAVGRAEGRSLNDCVEEIQREQFGE
ncbi:MAG: hypothetical protein A3D92_19845 [Bacteroidetes bacterium RIFCSPHIGHO2_02_FULL_44_7]|nr:MAG: hypothetical protein A3D92_19845 [Bacteroidetes bacterium RIFCSPHIGHO2_02_FULL_44_7]